MAIILFEDTSQRKKFYPLSFTRTIADLQLGIYTIKEWWAKMTGHEVYVKTTEAYLQGDIPLSESEEIYYINVGMLPNLAIWEEIKNLPVGHGIRGAELVLLATKAGKDSFIDFIRLKQTSTECNYQFIEYPHQLLTYHAAVLSKQFEWATKGRKSAAISDTNHLLAPQNIFVEQGAQLECCFLNATEGPIYIGKDALIMEGAFIRGPFALGQESVVKMGAKIYGATSTGKKCTIGGEIKNVLFNHYSNKAHDGYLGDSVIGSWCNFGAGASNSNVKNTASLVSLFDYSTNSFQKVAKKFGLLMGDYSRVAINSTINTGSSFGVCCNIFGTGFLPKYIPNFSWGVDDTTAGYQLENASNHINNWMALKGKEMTKMEFQILQHIFDNAEK